MIKLFQFLLIAAAVSNICFAQVIMDTVITYDDMNNPQDTMIFDCFAYIGDIQAPPASADGFCPSTDNDSLLLPTFLTDPNLNFDFSFIVTVDSDPNINQFNEEVVAVSSNGIVDFTGFPPATYCFTAISYQQSDLDIITNNAFIISLIPSYCLNGGESLEDIVFCIKENFDLANIESVTDSVLNDIVQLFVPEFQSSWDEDDGSTFNAPFCFDITPNGQEYCIEVEGASENCYVSIDAIFQNEVGLNNVPNPVNSSTTIQFELLNNSSVVLFVYDINGTEIYNKKVNTVNGLNSIEFSTENLENGVYVYGIQSDDKIAIQRMVVQK